MTKPAIFQNGQRYGSTDLTQVFQKYDVYSTSEKMIGCWTDNKPLYKKTFTWTAALTNASGETIKTVDIGVTVDKIVILEGILQDNASKWTEDMPFYKNESGNQVRIAACAWPNSSSTENKNKVGILYYGDCTWCNWQSITVYYTKTTDSALSAPFASENEYSDIETIVGTWFGKPLYQKTISCGALPNATEKQVNHNISNIDKVISYDGYFTNSAKEYFLKIPYTATQSETISASNTVQVFVTKSIIDITTRGNLSMYTESYVTLQYTKTS